MAITYRGTTLPFGKHSEETTDRATKEIAFPGVDGIEEMHMGKRARKLQVVGRITDFTGSFTKATIEGWNDTSVGSLVIHGTTYTNVRMESCSFGEAYTDKVTGKMGCTFTITFKKLK